MQELLLKSGGGRNLGRVWYVEFVNMRTVQIPIDA